MMKKTKDIPRSQRRWVDVNLAGSRFHNVDLTGSKIRGAMLVDVELDGLVHNVTINGVDVGPLVEKELDRPNPSEQTYLLLGRAAGAIHAATDDFTSSYERRPITFETEVDDQLALLRPALEEIDRWNDAAALGKMLHRFVQQDLSRGICHNDLTLDNIHIRDDQITVFDFDSAGEHWRASEPQGVFHFSVLTESPWWDCWITGYSETYAMSEEDQSAVPYFVLMCQFENAAWKLGLTRTSVGASIGTEELDGIVDSWVVWGQTHCGL